MNLVDIVVLDFHCKMFGSIRLSNWAHFLSETKPLQIYIGQERMLEKRKGKKNARS